MAKYSAVERLRIHMKAKRKLGLAKEETKQSDVDQCVIDLMDSGEVDNEDDARTICEEICAGE